MAFWYGRSLSDYAMPLSGYSTTAYSDSTGTTIPVIVVTNTVACSVDVCYSAPLPDVPPPGSGTV